MKQRFVSGRTHVEIKYSDKGFYTAKVRTPEGYETVIVDEPRHLERAVDSPRAFHDAAHAAISFSKHGTDYADLNPRGTGWSLHKPRRHVVR